MTTAQLSLPLAHPNKTRDLDARLAILRARLHGRRWVPARAMRESFTDRELRQLANHSAGEIITGQRGYCLLTEANPEEISRAANWLRSQARAMLARSIAIRRRAHQLI